MTLANLLPKDCVIAEMAANEQSAAIAELVNQLVETENLPSEGKDSILEALIAREEDRSTGIGNGVAIPHCHSDSIDQVALVFGRSVPGIDFFAIDRALVHFVVLFIVPKAEYALHLKTLAAIAKILNSADTREQLMKADDSNELHRILTKTTS